MPGIFAHGIPPFHSSQPDKLKRASPKRTLVTQTLTGISRVHYADHNPTITLATHDGVRVTVLPFQSPDSSNQRVESADRKSSSVTSRAWRAIRRRRTRRFDSCASPGFTTLPYT
jgi:hypothetical protein